MTITQPFLVWLKQTLAIHVAQESNIQPSVLQPLQVSSLPQLMPSLFVSNQMPTISVSQSISPIALLPIVIPKLLSRFVSNVAVTSSVASMSPSKFATVLSSASLAPPQKRPRGRPSKNPRIF